MPRNLTPLGHARVYRHPSTGELVVDTDAAPEEVEQMLSNAVGATDGGADGFADSRMDGEEEGSG